MRRPHRNLLYPHRNAKPSGYRFLGSPGSLSEPLNLGFLAAAGSPLFEDPIEFPQVFFRRIFGKLGFRGLELSVERHLAVQINHMAEPGAYILGGRVRLHKPLPKPLELSIYLLKERPEALACQVVTQNGCVKARLKSGGIYDFPPRSVKFAPRKLEFCKIFGEFLEQAGVVDDRQEDGPFAAGRTPASIECRGLEACMGRQRIVVRH